MNDLVYIMLIGVPASGKSTFIEEYLMYDSGDYMLYSSDHHIMDYAEGMDKTYDEIFPDFIKDAIREADSWRDFALRENLDVIDDHTNLTVNTRAKRLQVIPDKYTKIGLVFDIPEPLEHQRRLNSRPGKTIPGSVMTGMINSFMPPSYSEGFDIICKFGNMA